MPSLLSYQSLLRLPLAMTRPLTIYFARHGSSPPTLPIHLLHTIEVTYRSSISRQSYVPELPHTIVTFLVYLLGLRSSSFPHPLPAPHHPILPHLHLHQRHPAATGNVNRRFAAYTSVYSAIDGPTTTRQAVFRGRYSTNTPNRHVCSNP